MLEGCHDYLKKALFVVGEIGGNDFNFAFLRGGKTIDEAISYVPDVVSAIVEAVNVSQPTSPFLSPILDKCQINCIDFYSVKSTERLLDGVI